MKSFQTTRNEEGRLAREAMKETSEGESSLLWVRIFVEYHSWRFEIKYERLFHLKIENLKHGRQREPP